nr:MAG TPA: hypothetical protein [Caudoviricetes sp.]
MLIVPSIFYFFIGDRLGTTYILNVAIPTCSLFLWWR